MKRVLGRAGPLSRNHVLAAIAAIAVLLGVICPAHQPARAFGTATASAKPDIALTGRVVDAADVLGAAGEAKLTQQSERIERATRVRFVVVTTRSLHGLPINKYTLTLFNTWRLGNKARNDGLILLVAPFDQKVRIEVGKGLEKRLSNAFCATVIQKMLPSFRAGKLEQGLEIGASELEARLRQTMVRTQ